MRTFSFKFVGISLLCAAAGTTTTANAQVKGDTSGLPIWTNIRDVNAPMIPGGFTPRGTCPCNGENPENEGDCGIPVDTVNGGCNSTPPVYSTIAIGQSVCGTAQIGTADVRDTDWFRFTVTAATPNVQWTVHAEFPVQVLILNDVCPATLATATSVAAGGACTDTVCQAAGLAPGTYIAFVSPQQGSPNFTCADPSSHYVATLQTYVPPPPPANDNCGSATCFAGSSMSGTTVSATVDGAATCGTSNASPDVWFKYQPVDNGSATFSTCGSAYDTVLAAYPGCGQGQLVCNDDACGPQGLQSSVTFAVTAGTEYLVRVSGYNGAVGAFTLTLDSGPAAGPCGITAPRGSCCIAGACTPSRTAAECATAGGTYNGDASTCPASSYTMAAGGSAFQSIAGTGTLLAIVSACDDCTEAVTLPFSFPFYSNSYTSMNVSSNGNVHFGAANNAYFNDAIPSGATPNNAIYPLWDDYNTDEQGDVYMLTAGTAPNRTVTIEWSNVTQYTAGGTYPLTSESFQVVLSENGNAEFRYGTISPTDTSGVNQGTGQDASGGDRTIGVENADGTVATSIPSASFTGASQVVTRQTPAGPCSGPVCGTSDFDGDGDSGTDADIEAFFACLAGNCCVTCFPGGSDFNGDGDAGTDLDIESFFSVLAGGTCHY